MSPAKYFRVLIVVAVLGFLAIIDGTEARNLTPQEAQDLLSQADAYDKMIQQQSANMPAGGKQSQLDQLTEAIDEDDDDDDAGSGLIPANLPTQAIRQPSTSGNPEFRQASTEYLSEKVAASGQSSPAGDLKPEASKHYHHKGHGAKGWLDMGAWTGKKGAFGWYDKHPVGKGK